MQGLVTGFHAFITSEHKGFFPNYVSQAFISYCCFVFQVGIEENPRRLPPSLLDMYSNKHIQYQTR